MVSAILTNWPKCLEYPIICVLIVFRDDQFRTAKRNVVLREEGWGDGLVVGRKWEGGVKGKSQCCLNRKESRKKSRMRCWIHWTGHCVLLRFARYACDSLRCVKKTAALRVWHNWLLNLEVWETLLSRRRAKYQSLDAVWPSMRMDFALIHAEHW